MGGGDVLGCQGGRITLVIVDGLGVYHWGGGTCVAWRAYLG